MKKITGKKLMDLGFIKEEGDNFYYYVYEINDRALLISCASDEKVNGGYTVEFYEIDDIKFNDITDIEKLLEIINRNK
jgi:hypothetical protein